MVPTAAAVLDPGGIQAYERAPPSVALSEHSCKMLDKQTTELGR